VFGYLGYLIVRVFLNPKDSEAKPNSEDTKSWRSDHHESPVNDGDDISANWFHILDVPKTASREIITSAYKRKISQYHPDKVESLGFEFKQLAELKSKQINAAYNYAKQLRNQ
jgi:DnaJ like chaperone protein